MPVRYIELEYPIDPQSRYGFGKPPHQKLYEIIDRGREHYKQYMLEFFTYKDDLKRISALPGEDTESAEPYWLNQWLSGLDAVAIYSLLCMNNPKTYLEVGSGNSTRFAARAVRDHELRTKIISIDPNPRSEVDRICGEIIRQPVENVDLSVFDTLEAGDILFIDNSHRAFTNSDATVVFIDVLPRLKPGVFVEFHDIFLPYDYPPQWYWRFFSEQYLLACYLLAEGSRLEIILPNAFIVFDGELGNTVFPLLDSIGQGPAYRAGGSFWLRTC